ncbi:MAG: hypothetical protein R3B48_21510 [Kofleriaceae bacterium]
MTHAYVATADGGREFCIYYGQKEISFDEAHLFPFGERLTQESAFVAESATAWGPGYSWAELQPLLQTLIDEGLLQHEGDHEPERRPGGLAPSRLPPAASATPRMWSPGECEALFHELTGRPIELGYLESVIPSYRVAHPALDEDDRQVGEANVFPGALRLDRATEWRTCQYAGSRFRDERPMNVTALKAMIKHWKAMMATMRVLRAAALDRLPRSREGWAIGDLHSFARVVLSLPAYLLMRRGGAQPQPPLHPVLSSLFRITDGIRMVTHDMLFLSAERTWSPEERVTAADLYGFAERNGMFFSEVGVCAGPRALIEEFFAVVFEGAGAEPLGVWEPAGQVRELLDDLPAALDYGFLGLQLWAVSRSIWVTASQLHADLRDLCGGPLGQGDPARDPGAKLRARLEQTWGELARERLAVAAERDVHDVVYEDAYEHPGRALRAPAATATLAECLAAVEVPREAPALARLRELLARRLLERDGRAGGELAAQARHFAELVTAFLARAHANLQATAALQRRLNELLERPQPRRALDLRDLRLLFLLNPAPVSNFPFLLDELEPILGLRLEVTSVGVAAEERA